MFFLGCSNNQSYDNTKKHEINYYIVLPSRGKMPYITIDTINSNMEYISICDRATLIKKELIDSALLTINIDDTNYFIINNCNFTYINSEIYFNKNKRYRFYKLAINTNFYYIMIYSIDFGVVLAHAGHDIKYLIKKCECFSENNNTNCNCYDLNELINQIFDSKKLL